MTRSEMKQKKEQAIELLPKGEFVTMTPKKGLARKERRMIKNYSEGRKEEVFKQSKNKSLYFTRFV